MRFDNLSTTNQRLIGLITLLPIIAGFALSPFIAGLIIIALGGLMGWEIGKMAGFSNGRLYALVAVLAILGAPIKWWQLSSNDGVVLIAILIAMTGILSIHRTTRKVALFGLLAAICIAAASGLLMIPGGHRLILIIAAIIAACDSAAYFVGRFVGGPKLAPSISPKKTISGSVGGIAAAIIIAALCAPLVNLGVGSSVIAGVIVGVVAQMGDLIESSLKRTLGVKDSGSTIPGHGGVLDRFDGYLITLPVCYGAVISGYIG